MTLYAILMFQQYSSKLIVIFNPCYLKQKHVGYTILSPFLCIDPTVYVCTCLLNMATCWDIYVCEYHLSDLLYHPVKNLGGKKFGELQQFAKFFAISME